MSELRPFVPPAAPATTPQPTPARTFPESPAATTTTSHRSFTPPPAVSTEPKVDLQGMLDVAQARVDALQEASQSQSREIEREKSRFHEAFSALERGRAEACRVLARDAVNLGIEIGHALAGGAFEVDRKRLIELMEGCLREFSAEHPVQVRVSSTDAPHVSAHLESEGTTSVRVVDDPDLSPGDLTVDAEQLVIDARLVERVQTLREDLAAAVRADEALTPDEDEDESESESESGDDSGDDSEANADEESGEEVAS